MRAAALSSMKINSAFAGSTCQWVLSQKVGSIVTILGYGRLTTVSSVMSWFAGEGVNPGILPIGSIAADEVNCFLPRGYPNKWVVYNNAGDPGDTTLDLQIDTAVGGSVEILYTNDDVPAQGFHG